MEPRRGRTQENAEVRIVVDQQRTVERDSDMVCFFFHLFEPILTDSLCQDVKKPQYMEGIV